MRRRHFLAGAAAAAAGLVIPYEPRRVYSFPRPRLVTITPETMAIVQAAISKAIAEDMAFVVVDADEPLPTLAVLDRFT